MATLANVCAAVCAAFLFGLEAGTCPDSQPKTAGPEDKVPAQEMPLKVARIRVLRERRIESSMGPWPWDPPVACLWMDLSADLPKEVKFARVESVESESAQDSTGKDLVGTLLEKSHGDQLQALNDTLAVNTGTATLLWRLPVPGKEAKSLSASLVAKVRTYKHITAIDLDPELGTWKKVDIAGSEVQYQLRREGATKFIEFRPAGVAPHIFNVAPTKAPIGLPRGPSLRDTHTESYLYEPALIEEGKKPQVRVFEDEEIVSVILSVKDIELP